MQHIYGLYGSLLQACVQETVLHRIHQQIGSDSEPLERAASPSRCVGTPQTVKDMPQHLSSTFYQQAPRALPPLSMYRSHHQVNHSYHPYPCSRQLMNQSCEAGALGQAWFLAQELQHRARKRRDFQAARQRIASEERQRQAQRRQEALQAEQRFAERRQAEKKSDIRSYEIYIYMI